MAYKIAQDPTEWLASRALLAEEEEELRRTFERLEKVKLELEKAWLEILTHFV